jgi:hypothetical protein
MGFMKIYIAQYIDDDGATHIVGAYKKEKAAHEALIDEFSMVWGGHPEDPRPADVDQLNEAMDWRAEVIETEFV